MVGAEIERDGKAALDGGQPLGKVVGDARQQELVRRRIRRRPVAPPHQQPAVEDVVVRGHDAISS